MSEPKVWNHRQKDIPDGAVYVGRPTKFGNPFSHLTASKAEFRVETRDEAVDEYEKWLLAQPELVALVRAKLRGRDLVCWCAPQRCHAEVLLKVANQ